MNSKYNKCYCDNCCKLRSEDFHGTAGTDNRVYTKPFGWCKYVLRTPPRAEELNIFEQWNVAYHGTVISAVRPILDSGMLMLPGRSELGVNMC